MREGVREGGREGRRGRSKQKVERKQRGRRNRKERGNEKRLERNSWRREKDKQRTSEMMQLWGKKNTSVCFCAARRGNGGDAISKGSHQDGCEGKENQN